MSTQVPATYRSEWALFADWCAAFDLDTLPTSPITVARFLAEENPHASRRVRRRRVSAINTVHRAAGVAPPGTSTAVRRLLSTRDRHSELAAARLRELPVTGWPAGLFGRRDALVLWLVCVAGVPAAAIAGLRCADLTLSTPDTVLIGAGHHVEIPVDPADPFGLLPVWTRWMRVRNLMARYPGTTALVSPLTTARPVDPHCPPSLVPPPSPVNPAAALIPALDQWGHQQALPGHDTQGLSGSAVTALITAHLRGHIRGHRSRDAWVAHVLDRTRTPDDETAEPDLEATSPLPDRHLAGIAARRQAISDFDSIDETFDLIDRRTTELLARTERLLTDLGIEQ
ncbi:hypothetical protein [uncultured Gordonia sp.]|mgnify:CR=1 FL=1|uniref:hypothetical protein n=1 Tax=uncultured Gordonia sp. TaxID=198437 RepID=UPI00258696B4|nr:hypothetical protein [uncultured Gordonia sp.]